MDTINLFFNPKNVVLFGASDKPGSVGETTLKNLLLSKDTRAVYIVHPKHEMLMDVKCYPSLAALPEIPELAVIATGADHVPEIVEDGKSFLENALSRGKRQRTGSANKSVCQALRHADYRPELPRRDSPQFRIECDFCPQRDKAG